MKIEIKYDNSEVLDALNRLGRAGRDLTPAMRDVAQALESAVEDSFESEQSPAGDPWADLSPHTKIRRAKNKRWPGQILQADGRLAGSITSRYDSSSAEAGTNLAYASTHQSGAKRGEFGSTKRGHPVPFGDIPARPFLGRSEDLDEEILDALNRHFEDALRRR